MVGVILRNRFTRTPKAVGLAIIASLVVVASFGLSASPAASAEGELAVPRACRVSDEGGRVVEVDINDQRGEVVQWAIRADEYEGTDYAFLGRTTTRDNRFDAPFADGKWSVSVRALSADARSDWLLCGISEIPFTPPTTTTTAPPAPDELAVPLACRVSDEGGRVVEVDINDQRGEVVQWAIRADEYEGTDYAFLGRTTMRDNRFDAPFADGKWSVSVRALSADARSDWLLCGISEIPFTPEPVPIVLTCSALLRAGGDVIEVQGQVRNAPTDADFIFSASNVDTGEYVFYGRFESRGNETFADLDGTLLEPGTWTVQGRWKLPDGTRGERTDCATFDKVGDDPGTFSCLAEAADLDVDNVRIVIEDYNGDAPTFDTYVRVAGGDLIFLERVPYRNGLGFTIATLRDAPDGEYFDVVAQWSEPDGQLGHLQVCGTLIRPFTS